jgi:hypothetical protein
MRHARARRPARPANLAAGLLALASLACGGARTLPPPPPGPAEAARPAGRAPQATAAISGQVIAAADGTPLRRARVVATAPGLTDGRVALTNGNRDFTLSRLPRGTYRVVAYRTGYAAQALGAGHPLQPGSIVPLAEGEHLRLLPFELERAGVIAGRVLDEDDFVLADLMPGPYTIQVEGLPPPWMLRAVYFQGRALAGVPLDVEAGQRQRNLRVVLSDQDGTAAATVNRR